MLKVSDHFVVFRATYTPFFIYLIFFYIFFENCSFYFRYKINNLCLQYLHTWLIYFSWKQKWGPTLCTNLAHLHVATVLCCVIPSQPHSSCFHVTTLLLSIEVFCICGFRFPLHQQPLCKSLIVTLYVVILTFHTKLTILN